MTLYKEVAANDMGSVVIKMKHAAIANRFVARLGLQKGSKGRELAFLMVAAYLAWHIDEDKQVTQVVLNTMLDHKATFRQFAEKFEKDYWKKVGEYSEMSR